MGRRRKSYSQAERRPLADREGPGGERGGYIDVAVKKGRPLLGLICRIYLGKTRAMGTQRRAGRRYPPLPLRSAGISLYT